MKETQRRDKKWHKCDSGATEKHLRGQNAIFVTFRGAHSDVRTATRSSKSQLFNEWTALNEAAARLLAYLTGYDTFH